MNKTLLQIFEAKELGSRKWPDFGVGDTIKVYQKIKEMAAPGKKVSKTAKKAMESKGDSQKGLIERVQVFEGVVIAMKHGRGLNGTFTVRKVSGNVGVEKIFPFQTPHIEKIEITKRAKVRRAKLYYVRGLRGKKSRRKMKEQKFAELSVPGENQEGMKEEIKKEVLAEAKK